jgi:hypothetical protein
MILQCIPRPPKAQAQKNSALPADLQSCHQPKLVLCTPLALIHTHQAERAHRPRQEHTGLTCMFHEGGCESHVFAKRINLPGWFLGIGALGQFVPIHFQEKCAVTA